MRSTASADLAHASGAHQEHKAHIIHLSGPAWAAIFGLPRRAGCVRIRNFTGKELPSFRKWKACPRSALQSQRLAVTRSADDALCQQRKSLQPWAIWHVWSNRYARWSASVPAERPFHLQLESENLPFRRHDRLVACKNAGLPRLLQTPIDAGLSRNLLQVA